MPEANQYTISHRELLELIIKKTDVHEGRWMLLAQFGLASGNFGPNPAQMAPGVAVAVINLGIQRAPADAPEALVADAAVVNPVPKDSKKKRKG